MSKFNIILTDVFLIILVWYYGMRGENAVPDKKLEIKRFFTVRWKLVIYDILLYAFSALVLVVMYREYQALSWKDILINYSLACVCIIFSRFLGNIYRQVWRYGGVECYIRVLLSDAFGGMLFLCLSHILTYVVDFTRLTFARSVALVLLNTVMAIGIRLVYRYCYKCANNYSLRGKILHALLRVFAPDVELHQLDETNKIKVAIIGAGSSGVSLAEELLNNNNTSYVPKCFVDQSDVKFGRDIYGIPVFSAEQASVELFKKYEIQEVIIALPNTGPDNKRHLYNRYRAMGCKVKLYDYPTMQSMGGKRKLREFNIEDLLFREPIEISDAKTKNYYKDKVVLITGGGGSIGSELCRQLAKMNPRQIIVLDIYENGVYDVQQDLKFHYGKDFDIRVEIASITNRSAMARVFETYHPDIVINAAAHKHVPLMEHNCVEAVENNVFGTKTVLDLCLEYNVKRFMMVSTDKAVNPTNVMGATKRMCEMLALSYAANTDVKCSCTRFGNVLGSAGSVIPLFKKQIEAGGPITITDKRIIRYFMTIPEASQLVLQSGALARDGELFVLDMGQQVKILELAENMIELSGAKNIEIVETGLRPGEKLYEELLIKSETLTKTENELIFVEKDEPLSLDEVNAKLDILRDACKTGSDDTVREALRKAVPTFKRPEEVNKEALKETMQ